MLDHSGRFTSPAKRAAYDNQLQEKVARLQREFYNMDLNHDQWVSRQELYTYLDRRGGKTFDRAIADDIFDQMDKDSNEQVTIDEFIRVFIQAEEILQSKIDKARETREALRRDEEDYTLKAQKAAMNEGNIQGGQAQGGLTHVNIKEATLNQSSGNLNLFVEVYLDKQQIAKTKVIDTRYTLLKWEEQFTFEARDLKSEIRFVLCDRGTLSTTLLGQAMIHVSDLNDQQVHLVWENLIGRDGQTSIGQLLIESQWIYSKAKFYKDQAMKCRENASLADQDAQDYERMLQNLLDPFSGLQVAHQAEHIQSRYPGLSTTDQQFVMGMKTLATKFGKEGSLGFWNWLATVIAFAQVIIGILLMFGKSSFIDACCGVLILMYIHLGSLKEVVSLRIVAFGILVSVGLDVLWIFIFWGKWDQEEINWMEKNYKLRTVIFFLTLISMGARTILAALCYMINIESSTTAPGRGSVSKPPVMRSVSRSPSPQRVANPF